MASQEKTIRKYTYDIVNRDNKDLSGSVKYTSAISNIYLVNDLKGRVANQENMVVAVYKVSYEVTDKNYGYSKSDPSKNTGSYYCYVTFDNIVLNETNKDAVIVSPTLTKTSELSKVNLNDLRYAYSNIDDYRKSEELLINKVKKDTGGTVTKIPQQK